MKKLIFAAFLLSFLFATPSYAKGTIYINGQEQKTESIVVNGTTYVPLRLVAENLGAQVSYDGDVHVSDDFYNNQLQRPEIIGNESFRGVINEALNLLKERDFPHYVMVCQNVKSIATTPGNEQCSVCEEPLDYIQKRQFKIPESVYEDENLFIPEIMASAIVHDCTHFVQSRYGYYETQNKTITDMQAFLNEYVVVLSLIDAPEWYIEFVITKIQTLIYESSFHLDDQANSLAFKVKPSGENILQLQL